MAGIYIHIPFCRKKCHYCDFYKTTAIQKKPLFLDALYREIDLRADYLKNQSVETIYFGGGTPSVLSAEQIAAVLQQLYQNFPVENGLEITMEANPDDLNRDYLSKLLKAGINRLSIGIQSFSDQDLLLMNRRHSTEQAVQSVTDAHDAGFSDISVDLIYGIPGLSLRQWEINLKMAIGLPVNHLSAYHMTYHEGTPFFNWINKQKISELPEEESIAQFETLLQMTRDAGFEQYEISNFAREQAYSKHNSHYWTGQHYLGLGPSAHSYNGMSRQWNPSNLHQYLSSLQSGSLSYGEEILTTKDKLNDYLITRIRTKWGISLEYIRSVFGEEYRNRITRATDIYLNNGSLKRVGDSLVLTPRGMMISDQIMLALLID